MLSARSGQPTNTPHPVSTHSGQPFTPTCVLVTGSAGFIMSHVVDELLRTLPEVHVVGYDKLTYCGHPKNMALARKLGGDRFTFVRGDITNLDHVKHVLHQFRVDAVIAGAAETHVDLSLSQSLDFTHTNVLGTHTLLEAVRQYREEGGKLIKYIHVSTDEVIDYGDETIPADEKAHLFATSPYAASKAAAELICSGFKHSFKIPIIITRGNNCAPSDTGRCFVEKLIPKFITRISRGQKLTIHGDGTQKRSFLSVKDTARAFVLLLTKGVVGEIYNIGSDEEFSVLDVARKILEQFDVTDKQEQEAWLEYGRDRPFTDKRYYISNEKLKVLGWTPTETFDTALRGAITWYTKHQGYWGHIDAALEAHPQRQKYE